jgi:hypothetical protein
VKDANDLDALIDSSVENKVAVYLRLPIASANVIARLTNVGEFSQALNGDIDLPQVQIRL